MSKITLITPPDRIYSSELSILLVYPTGKTKEQLQNILALTDLPVHVYVYELTDDHEVEWLFDVQNLVDYTIIDVDNCDPDIRDLVSYMLSRDNTYWLTNGSGSYYNVISKKQVFNLDFLQSNIIGGPIEKPEIQ